MYMYVTAVVYLSTPFALLYPLIEKLTIFETMEYDRKLLVF